MLTYAEHAPPPALADAVRCIWTMRGALDANEPALTSRILPDNCIDVIFDLTRTDHGSAYLVGPMLNALVLEVRGADTIGARFAPGAATEFLPLSADELTPANIEAVAVWPDAASLAGRLRLTTPGDRVAVLGDYLIAKRRANAVATMARSAAAFIERAHGAVTVAGLTQALGVSERTLQRAFDTAVGISPKQVIKVQRFRAAAAMVAARTGMSLSRIAATCGYADHAHFAHDFSALAGITPSGFRDERRLVGFVQD